MPSTGAFADDAIPLVLADDDYITLYRFADADDLSSMRPRGTDPATMERAAAHMAGDKANSPFLSLGEDLDRLLDADDFQLNTIIYGTYAPGVPDPWPGYARAPHLFTVKVPRASVIRASDVPGAPDCALGELEVLVTENLWNFDLTYIDNPFHR